MPKFLGCLISLALYPLCCGAADVGTGSGLGPHQPPERQRIAQLIQQLGEPTYAARQEAQRELNQLGLAAFDQIYAATNHPDLEVAAASQYLLEGLTVHWVRRGDPPQVRRILDPYGQYTEIERRQSAAELAKLSDWQGIPALVRIARFDPSPRVSREAAVRAMQVHNRESHNRRVHQEHYRAIADALNALAAEYGQATRPAGVWLQLFAQQASDPAGALTGWENALRREREAVENQARGATENLLWSLHWNWLRVQLAAEQYDGLKETVDTLIQLKPDAREATLTAALEWMIDVGANSGVDGVLESRSDELLTKRGLYLAAIIRDKQGRSDQSTELAEQAFQTPPQPGDDRIRKNVKLLDGRYLIGLWLQQQGYAEWARREYREAMQQTPVISVNSTFARNRLADSLQDHAEYAAAADTLSELLDAIGEDKKSAARYRNLNNQLPDYWGTLPAAGTLRARRSYYRALAARDSEQFDKEIEHLREAIKYDPSDADIVIAMYRAEGADDSFRQETRGHISRLAKEMKEQIEASPEHPSPYNQWAWLIANTEGDFAQAVQYSQRSLELADSPNEPTYLDTLGRCYFALGDLEQAIETQRRAVAGQPYLMVMQRQLEMFEKAQAAQAEPKE